MNRIVRDHYPASKLPADLREGIPDGAEVSVTVEVSENPRYPGFPPEPASRPMSAQELWTSVKEYQASPEFQPATDDPVARIRALRDEWDDE